MNDCFDAILDILNNHCEGGSWSLKRKYRNSNVYGEFCYEIALDEEGLPTLSVCFTYKGPFFEHQIKKIVRSTMYIASAKIGRMLIGDDVIT